MKEVSFVSCKNYNSVYKSVKKAVDMIGGIKKFVKPKQKVLIKMNCVGNKEVSRAATTHPEVIRAIIRLVKEAKGIPYVGDSPAGFLRFSQAVEITGIKKVCKEEKTGMVDLETSKSITNSKNKVIKKFVLAKELKNFDVIINAPKLKTHSLAVYTGAVKNLYGCVPGTIKMGYHAKFKDEHVFSDLLLDLYQTINPGLNIMDAVVGMEGNGPMSGEPIKLGFIAASGDALALDAAVTHCAGIYSKVPIIYLAKKRKWEQVNLNKIKILGEREHFKLKLGDVHSYIFAKVFLRYFRRFRNFILAKPNVNREKCIHCATCSKFCPASAITMVKGFPEFDYGKCIRCYCCHEVCPADAIYLKKNWFINLVKRT